MGFTLLVVILAIVIIVALVILLPAVATAIRNSRSDNRELNAAKAESALLDSKVRVYERTLREIILNSDSALVLAVSAQDEVDQIETKALTTGGNK